MRHACLGHQLPAGKTPRSRWMVYGLNFGPNEILGENSVDGSTGDGNLWMVNGRTGRDPPVKGLVSLFPCIDGTLAASVYRRTVTKDSDGQSWIFEATDTLDLYTADYTIDLKATSNSGWNRSLSPSSGSIVSCMAVRCPHK